jgi:catechol 2,3-dioxygenase-like lactoylglutathione lyase family enzyme
MKQTQPIETGIAVTDLDRMLGFYTDVLSCKEVRRAPIPAELSEQLTLAPDGYLCVWLQTPGGEVIKLMSAPQAPEVLDAPKYLTGRSGIAYLTFYCSDLGEVLAAAEAAGAALMSDRALVAPDAPLRLCFFTDPEGNVIELVQPADA